MDIQTPPTEAPQQREKAERRGLLEQHRRRLAQRERRHQEHPSGATQAYGGRVMVRLLSIAAVRAR